MNKKNSAAFVLGTKESTNTNNFFKVYQSLFEKESNVTNLPDSTKVLLMLISSEINKKDAANKKTNRAEPLRTTQDWLASALSTSRKTISKGMKSLHEEYGIFDYTRGHHLSAGKNAPGTITDLKEEDFFIKIDRNTFEILLFDKLKNKEIKHRHIVIYAICQYIEKFKGGNVSVNEFGHMLGRVANEIKYSHIKKPLEDLKAMELINFQKTHGKIENIEVRTLPLGIGKREKLRSDISEKAEEERLKRRGISHKETAAAVEDQPISNDIDDIYSMLKDIYAKQTGKRLKLSGDQKNRIRERPFTISQLDQLTREFLEDKIWLERFKTANDPINRYIVFLQLKQIEIRSPVKI